MPKRSNDFQKLIYLIHHQIAEAAVVTESKFLYDKEAKIDREVDIVIEAQISDYPMIIGIECQGRGRVANIEWVEQMIQKHRSLPTDKLILVSRSDFTPAARNKAKNNKVETMSWKQAIQADWYGMVGLSTVKLGRCGIEPEACFAIVMQHDSQADTVKLDFNRQISLSAEEDSEMLTVYEMIGLIIDIYAEDIMKQLREQSVNEQRPYIVFSMVRDVPGNIFFIDNLGVKRKVSKLHIIGRAVYESELVNMQQGSFGSAQVAFGKTHEIDAESIISIVEYEDKPGTAAILLPPDSQTQDSIINLREVKEAIEARKRWNKQPR